MSAAITAKSLLAELRKFSDTGGGVEEAAPLWVVNREGDIWLGSACWLIRPTPVSEAALRELWELCNLPLLPDRVIATLAITKVPGAVPDVESLFPAFYELETVQPRPVEGGYIAHETEDGVLTELWRRADGAWTPVASAISAFVRRHAEPAEWRQGKKPPVIGIDKYGQVCALIAPVNLSADRLIRDPDLPTPLFEI